MRPSLVPFATLALISTAAAQTAPPKPSELPITRVALYKNGVGFFEHAGKVSGDQAVTIDFTSAQLNDVLQSLTAIDLNGGRISGAGYNSTTPLDEQLKTLPLALTDDPSDVDFYNAIRGARVQISGAGLPVTGRLLSIDLRGKTKKNGDDSTDEQGERRFVTVVSESGAVRTVELTSAVSVTLLDSSLHTDVTRYLELLASTRNQGLRHLTLLDRGTGARDLRVSYISEVPVWKSTYRILFTDAKAAAETTTLQGWSVVDNTTGTDWTNVHLDLIAGAPQSFIQPLSTPYYSRRPEIGLPSEAQLSPQTFESGNAAKLSDDPDELSSELHALAGPASGANGGQIMIDGFTGGQLAPRAKAPAPVMMGRSGGTAGGVLGGMMGGSGNASTRVMNGVALDALADDPGELYQGRAAASFNPNTTTAAFDDFFEYTLTDPITIRKNESALVPILQTKLPIERVTVWSQRQPVALRALWMTNASNLTLDRGSFSIVENGNFGGEGLLDPIHPGEKRLLSYAADQAVRVTTSGSKGSRHVNHLKIVKGVLTETSTDVNEVTYDVHNAAPDARMVIVEHPVRQGWKLDSDPKPAETTPTAYRFRVEVAAGATVPLHVGERHTDDQRIALLNQNEDQLRIVLRNANASAKTMAALQPVFDARNAVTAIDVQLQARRNQIGDITKDQSRLRENMKALKGSPEEKALLTRYTGELNAQEDQLAFLNKEIADLQTKRTAAQAEYEAKLNGLNLEEDL